MRGFTDEDVAAILEARGGGGGEERGGVWNAGMRRPREWLAKRTRSKRMRKVDRHRSVGAAAVPPSPPSDPSVRNSDTLHSSALIFASSRSQLPAFTPLRHPALHGDLLSSVLSFLPSPTRTLSSSSSASSSSSSHAALLSSASSCSSSSSSSSFSSSSASPAASAPSAPLALWSSRSYLRRLVHAKLSLLPNCTPWLNPSMLASLFSVTSLHLFSFPFVTPVFFSEVEGSDWTEEESRLHSLEKEAYEREEKKRLQEQSDRERKQLKDNTGDKRERMLLNAAWFMRRGHREEMEDVLRVMEMQGLRRRRLVERAAGGEAALMEELKERDGDDGPEPPLLRQLDPRLLHLNDWERDRPMHPFWYHAALERKPPKEVGHLSLLASLASQLTALAFSPSTLTQSDLTALSCLHSLTSLSLHPHASEGLRPAEAIADFLSSFPLLESLSLYSEEAVAFPRRLPAAPSPSPAVA